MKAVWRIFRADLHRAHRSIISLVVVLGLVVLPSIFAWFNIAASWDPFANTKNLRIAIANSDEGYKSDLVPLKINIGDQVVAALRANADFDWVVDSEAQAVEKTRSGEYYAARDSSEFLARDDDLLLFGCAQHPADLLHQREEERFEPEDCRAGSRACFRSDQSGFCSDSG